MRFFKRNKIVLELVVALFLVFLSSHFEVKKSLFNNVWGNYSQYEWGWPFGFLIDNQAVSGIGYWNIDDKFSMFAFFADFLIIYLLMKGLISVYSYYRS